MPLSHRLDLSHGALDLAFSLDRGLTLERWTRPSARPWIEPSSPLCAVVAGGRRFDGRPPYSHVHDVRLERSTNDLIHAVIVIGCADVGLQIDLHIVVYPGTTLLEQWIVVRNTGVYPVRIDKLDSFALHLPRGEYELLSFSSGWGAEFESTRRQLDEPVVLESRSGRSSNGMHPFFVLSRTGEMLSASVAWSGNWAIRFQPNETGYAISGGLSDWEFSVDLPPGQEIDAPHVMVVLAADLDLVAQQYHGVGRRFWYPRNETSARLPFEWNHWWSYEDQAIDEKTFRANVEVAAQLGLELCTLDAGWFGPSDADAAWANYRGDWERVNLARFPHGIRSLSDHVHAHGRLFGLWCEIEALGEQAQLGQSRPEFRAQRNGTPLGYLCFGCATAQEWALATLERLTAEYKCDWIKLDFNVDPGAGCNRSDHGHGTQDGLYAHYQGYYSVLSRFRSRNPQVTLENCSSGGLRIDLGIMSRAHVTFLSDPDWPEHNLQVFWGATLMLAPEVCLHWGPSQWLTPHPRLTFDAHDPTLTRQQLDFHIRTALLGAAGVSLRLPDLPPWIADRIAFHANLYKDRIRHFVRAGILYRLTDQPKRDASGDRWCGFQYSLPGEHLVIAFRLRGAEMKRSLRLRNLDASTLYRVDFVDDGHEQWHRGSDLMCDGFCVDWLHEDDSTIVIVSEEYSGT